VNSSAPSPVKLLPLRPQRPLRLHFLFVSAHLISQANTHSPAENKNTLLF